MMHKTGFRRKMKNKIRKFAPRFLISWYHFFWALAGAFVFGFPGKRIKVIGVTGTNGKTTTIELISAVLKQAGYKVAILSSIKFQIGDEQEENKLRMTMPGRARVQRFLKQAVEAKCDYGILEITSEGIVQHRHRFIDFEVAVLTNLSPEHIESHGSFTNYRATKLKFFNDVKNIHILNLDDENFKYFNQFKPARKYFYGFGKAGGGPSSTSLVGQGSSLPDLAPGFVAAENIQVSSSGIKFFVNNQEFNLNLLGEFNVYNALAAICVGLSQGVDFKVCKEALEKVQGIAGRMEMVIKEPFKVFVDYAFTPNALEQVYKSIRDNWLKGRMICVLGACGGGRDKWKRPVLGGLAGKYCQRIVVTNEDPYDEDPNQILLEIKSGILNESPVLSDSPSQGEPSDRQTIDVILGRREAIGKALAMAEIGDVVVITGKGCEPSICLAGGEKMPWDDRRVVREEFEKIRSEKIK